jgi:pimeloyl-ACP methyl ester carboxylesterase
MTMIGEPRSALRRSGVAREIERRGKGDPLPVPRNEEALELPAPFLDALAKTHELIIPPPPGFGRSERPAWITDPDEIAYIFLDLVEQLRVMRVPVPGFSLGNRICRSGNCRAADR